MKLVIPEVPISLNRLLRLHWRDRQELNAAWVLFVRAAFLPNGAARSKMRVTITLHHSRLFDKDNAYGAVKVCVDALKTWHIIRDDTAEWLDLSVKQERCSHKTRHTVIEVSEANP
jgi:hypothetical protein